MIDSLEEWLEKNFVVGSSDINYTYDVLEIFTINLLLQSVTGMTSGEVSHYMRNWDHPGKSF